MKVTERHRQFVEEYCTTGNATRSYMKVFKCAESTAKARASRLLNEPEIREEVKEIQYELWKKTRMSSVEVLALLADIARGNSSNMVTQVLQNGKVIQVEERVSTKDRLQALQLIGKNMKMFTDRVDVNANVKKSIKINVVPMSEKMKKDMKAKEEKQRTDMEKHRR